MAAPPGQFIALQARLLMWSKKHFRDKTRIPAEICIISLTVRQKGVKEFHMLARIGCNCKIMVFSPFITYYHSSKGNK